MNRRAFILISACAALTASTVYLAAGPLNPPAGPITGTGKTLLEVEPRIAINATNTPGDADSVFRIAQPGSYYLTGNITGVVGKQGIEIVASGVSIDMQGFEMVGVPGALDGIAAGVASLSNLAVRQGSFRSWPQSAIDFANASATNVLVHAVLVDQCGSTGINLGINSVVTECSVRRSGGSGFVARFSSTMSDCVATENSAVGFLIDGSGCTITNCNASDNGVGFAGNFGAVLTGCSAFSNTTIGISVGAGSTITSCSSRSNGTVGITSASGSSFFHCTATANGTAGISASSTCQIRHCTVDVNGTDGIVVSSGCLVVGNSVTSNGTSAAGGAGIHATGGDNRIEQNTCTNADRGIEVDAGGNIIISNTCANNTTNWDIAANNYYGAIINRSGAATAAVAGNTAASTLATTDPHANITY